MTIAASKDPPIGAIYQSEYAALLAEDKRLRDRNKYLEECVRALDDGNKKISDELNDTRRELQAANELIERIKATLFEILGTLPDTDGDVKIDFYYDDGLDSMGRYVGGRI